jgi:hypothetical protein
LCSQPTTHVCPHQKAPPLHHQHRNGGIAATVDTGLSDDTFTDSQTYYDYYHPHGYRHERSYSDDSGSTRLPCHYENDDESCRRLSRNTYSTERSHGRKGREGVNPVVHKDVRRVYPQQQAGIYQEIPPQALCDNISVPSAAARRPPTSRLSDRPQSSMSSGVTSAIVDGCGGKCQTFENVCYFFLQLVFMMGILIGVSLCIAGLVLRKSAARNLQVLVYIGILLAIVSSVLLGIQWNARNVAKKRKLAVRNAKRAPIPLETLHPRNQQLQQPLMVVQDGQRIVPHILRPLPAQPDQQGIPWWRRKDLI